MSNIIKVSGYTVKNEAKVVDQKSQPPQPFEEVELPNPEMEQIISERDSILAEAQQTAEEMLRDVQAKIAQLKEETKKDIESWWHEKRESDQQVIEDSKEMGFSEGYSAGFSQAELKVQELYSNSLKEAGEITEQAIDMKQHILGESEPLIIELACKIAEKIMAHEFEKDSDHLLELARKVLTRRHERGIITLCIAPGNYSFMCESREELTLQIDSQAELNIVADATIKDHGCIVRSDFGSIDARIDTQLSEIKKALVQIAQRNEDQ